MQHMHKRRTVRILLNKEASNYETEGEGRDGVIWFKF